MTKLANLFDAAGRLVPLGDKLGSGGDGDAYKVPAISHDLVAKIYRNLHDPDQQEKLRVMVQEECDDSLKKVVAWPTTTLHLRRNGPICGFLMPKVMGHEPHKFYSPAHRKQLFPKADWAFLVNAARNVAAAFDVVHAYGHVIGDVNQRNIFVTDNSIVKLIDCDSFQIVVNGKPYLCKGGVLDFTPPELRSLQSFSGVRRTVNHDNFGLAVLCFHLLFMGRHPFAGVYSGQEEMPIEKAIPSFRFAFGKNASSKGMSPPPDCVTMEIVPPQVASLFERAFSESGAHQDSRPTAREWVGMLDYLKHNLLTCGQEPMHKYFGGLASCPWCRLERQSGVLFFIGIIPIPEGQAIFTLTVVWQRIMSVASPGEAPSIDPGQFTATPKSLPKELHNAKTLAIVKKASAVVIVIGTLAVYPGAFIIGIIVALILFFSGVNDSAERRARKAALNHAQSNWNAAEQRWRREVGNGIFKEKLQELERLKSQYERLDTEHAQEKQKLEATIRERQLHKFLDNLFIDDHTIPNIGPGRKTTLASFGIETAADIDPHKIRRIKGFGRSLTDELMRWRKSRESRFVFDPAKGIDPADVAALDQKFRQRRAQLESALLAGPEMLNQVRADAIRKRQSLQVEVEAAARALAQACSDMSVFK